MSKEIEELAAALHARSDEVKRSKSNKLYRKRWLKIAGLFIVVALITAGILVVILLTHKQNPNQAALQKIAKNVSFPLFYPDNMPNFFFMDNGSVQSSNGIVFFSIDRVDQQKIYVTEENLPPGFNLNQVTGTRSDIPNVGTMVIGTGFQGYRAVIQAKNTLIFVSGSSKINVTDFGQVAKSFKPL
jgi:hypothetical protein